MSEQLDEVEVTVTLPAGTWRVILDELGNALEDADDSRAEPAFVANEMVIARLKEAQLRLSARLDQLNAEIDDVQ